MRIALSSIVLSLLLAGPALAQSEKASPYPVAAPMDQYRIASVQEEIALARSSAPPSISADATVLVLGRQGYETAVKGKNGFVCFIERSWTAGFSDPQFWNPKIVGPNCFNPPAVHSVLPQFVKRTEWVLAGMTREKILEKARAAMADHTFMAPDPGSFSFMLSRQGYLGDAAGGPWLPHVMFFVPHGTAAAWGAGLKDSPVLGSEGDPAEPTVLYIPVARWSDGSPAAATTATHRHSQ
jgi:hypothetical protein